MNTNILLCLVGETGTGKDTVAKYLGLNQVVSYTTRPKREHETNGKEHYFITEEEYKNIINNEHIIAPATIGNTKYFAIYERLEGDNIYIIEPSGVEWIHNNPIDGLNVITIGLYVPLEERMKRCSWRSDFESSFKKRVEDESQLFERFRINGDFDYIINNKNSQNTANIIKQIIKNKKEELFEINKNDNYKIDEDTYNLHYMWE